MTDQTAATECAFADEGCTCGRPRLTLTEAQARMAATPKPGPTFATYLDRHDRDQLDARAACAEQERDEALDARDVLRQQLDQAQQRNRDLAHLLSRKRDTISALAAELGDAHDLIAEIRNNRANDDRAFARWETRQPGQQCSPPCTLPKGHPMECDASEPGLGSAPPRAQEPSAADLLRQAAAGRREYAKGIPEKAEPLELQAHTLDAAACVVEGDLSPLYDWLPSWKWTDDMHARLHATRNAPEPS